MSTLPKQYKSYQDVFEKKNVDILSQNRPYDCAIDIDELATLKNVSPQIAYTNSKEYF